MGCVYVYGELKYKKGLYLPVWLMFIMCVLQNNLRYRTLECGHTAFRSVKIHLMCIHDVGFNT